jgi:hypothetical protein
MNWPSTEARRQTKFEYWPRQLSLIGGRVTPGGIAGIACSYGWRVLAGIRDSCRGGSVGRRWAAIALVILATLGLSACGSTSANRAPTSSIVPSAAKVYELTVSANSADFQFAFAVGPTGVGETSTESGTYSWASNQGTVTNTGAFPGAWAFTSQEIVHGNVQYSKIVSKSGPQSNIVGALFDPGNGWTESTVSGNTSTSWANLLAQGFMGVLGGSLEQPNVVNPANLLTILRSDPGPVTDIGSATVDGIATTHYRTLVPMSALAGSGGASTIADELFGSRDLTVDYWIDSGDQLRMLRVATTFSPPKMSQSPPSTPTTTSPTSSSGDSISIDSHAQVVTSGKPLKGPLTVSVTLQLSNYGIDAQVSIPPPSEITSHESCTVSSSGYQCTGP